jgi:phytoene dehydrogenase-like protein
MAERFDVAVVGAGHNGLVAAGYLARAGLKVVVLEARHTVGGACVSEPLIPGATWSSCAFVQGMLRPEVIAELELAKHGLRSISPDVQGFALWEDGDHVMLWQDVDRSLASIERHNKADAQGFFRFATRLKRFGDITRPWLLQEPPSRSEVLAAFEEAGELELLNEFVLMSAGDLLGRYIESPRLRGYMMFLGMVSTWGGPSTPGTSYVYGYHAQGEFDGVFGRWALPVGGMGAITQALANSARAHGAVIRTSAPVERIQVAGGRVTGVVLASGEEIAATTVASNADPKRTLGKLVGAAHLPAKLAEAVGRLDQRGSMARVHLLIDELPHYVGFPEAGLAPHHRGHAILGATPERYELAWEAQRRGEIVDEMVIEALIHSTVDPSVAPAGKHTLVLGVQQLPYHLAKGTWDDVKESWADRVVEGYCRFAPNIRNHILGRHTITPLDLEREYNLTGGNIFQGSMVGLEHLFDSRPLPGLGHYRMPIEGLYLCGAGCHPGGGVTGAPGHNAAGAIIADLRGESRKPAAGKRGKSSKAGVVDRLLDTAIGQELGYKIAKGRTLRGLTAKAAKTRKD